MRRKQGAGVRRVLGDAGGRTRPSSLVRNALALTASSVGTAVLGFGFWAVAARMTDPRRVGLASAEVTAMMLIANLGDLGVGAVLLRFLPSAGERTRSVVVRSYAVCTSLGLVIGSVYVVAGLSDRFLPPGPSWRVLFVAASALWAIFVLQDSVLVGLRSAKWVAVENVLFSTAKIVLLPLMLAVSLRQGVFLAWSLPVVGAVLGVNLYLFRSRIPEWQAGAGGRASFPGRRELFSFVGALYGIRLVNTVVASAIPLIVLFRSGAVANGHFYVPWAVSSAVYQLLTNVSTSFVVEASHDPADLRRHVDRMVRFGLVVVVPAIVVGVAFAPLFLRVFGTSYSRLGTTLLRLLLLGVPGAMVTTFYSSFALLERHVWWLAGRVFASSAVFVAATLLLIGHLGIVGVGVAALVTEVVQAMTIFPVAMRRYRAVRREPPAREDAPR